MKRRTRTIVNDVFRDMASQIISSLSRSWQLVKIYLLEGSHTFERVSRATRRLEMTVAASPSVWVTERVSIIILLKSLWKNKSFWKVQSVVRWIYSFSVLETKVSFQTPHYPHYTLHIVNPALEVDNNKQFSFMCYECYEFFQAKYRWNLNANARFELNLLPRAIEKRIVNK